MKFTVIDAGCFFLTTELIYTCADRSTARSVQAHTGRDAALPGTRRGEGGFFFHTKVTRPARDASARTAAFTPTPCRYFAGPVPPEPFLETYLKRPNPRSFFLHQGVML